MLTIGNYTRILRKKVASFLVLLVGLCPADALLKARCLEALRSSMSNLLHLFCWSIGLIFPVPYFYREIFICSFKLSLCCLCFLDGWKIFLQFVIWSFNQVCAFCNKCFAQTSSLIPTIYCSFSNKQNGFLRRIIDNFSFNFRSLCSTRSSGISKTCIPNNFGWRRSNAQFECCWAELLCDSYVFHFPFPPGKIFCKFCFDQNQTTIFRQWAISQWASRMCT